MGNDPDSDFNLMIALVLVFLSVFIYSKIPQILAFSREPVVRTSTIAIFGVILFIGSYFLFKKIEINAIANGIKNQLFRKSEGSVFCGFEKGSKKPVYITQAQRTMHTQIVGTTNAGKTESVILPWAIQDIKNGNGLIIIDGKSDRGLLNKLWAYTCKYCREKDFQLFSLGHIEESSQYNPLLGDSPEEIIERVFSAFEFENSYYKNVQFEVFANLIRLFFSAKRPITFKELNRGLNDTTFLAKLNKSNTNTELSDWVDEFIQLPPKDRDQKVSGLRASISHFANGNTAELFNSVNPTIDVNSALKENKILYFQLPVLLSPFLGSATGKMILQSIQNAVGNRHRGTDREPQFFSIFLDDFTEYLYPGFVSILNKSRSANVGIVFAHQALGDIKGLGDSIANSILTNSNLKVFMRGNDPESAEYFSNLIGTQKTHKITERKKKTLFKETYTGDQSAREVEAYIVHPNKFKKGLGTGEAIMVAPVFTETQTVELKFQMFPDLETEKTIISHKTHQKPPQQEGLEEKCS